MIIYAGVFWALAQYSAFFASAWLISRWAGGDIFGAWSQSLALATILATLVPLRMEYAGQLEKCPSRAESCFTAARMLAYWLGIGACIIGVLSAFTGLVPLWVASATLAITPLALMQIRASFHAREGRVAPAAIACALPALFVLPIQATAWWINEPEAVIWSLPIAAWISCAYSIREYGIAKNFNLYRLIHSHWKFVRAEWLGQVLNTAANHGQVLAVGFMAGDSVAGTIALGLRIAMISTSLVGPAWADSLRSKVVASNSEIQTRIFVMKMLRHMICVSISLHIIGALIVYLLLPHLFPTYGQDLIFVVLLLLPLGAVRMVASPMAFLLAWRGWLGLSILGQVFLFLAALGAAIGGGYLANPASIAAIYTGLAGSVYLIYIIGTTMAAQPSKHKNY